MNRLKFLIKKYRIENNLSLEELSQKLDLNRITLIGLEQGRIEKPTAKTLHKLTKIINIEEMV